TAAHPPRGFLFVCPLEDFRTGETLSSKWPECSFFWSLDPSGANRLTAEDAINFGFPVIELSMETWGKSWDGKVYAGLSQFHQAKGFDPYGQDLARHLGYSLYELSDAVFILFAHSESPIRKPVLS
ncbi:hypothetical protein K438DRAFT_1598285, partial [Mycena galopus ATCC 62051]